MKRKQSGEEKERSTKAKSSSGEVVGPSAKPLYCSAYAQRDIAVSTNVDSNRARLIWMLKDKWLNGTVLHYFFIGGDDVQKNFVRQAFKEWKDVGIGLEFVEVDDMDKSEIRISFVKGDGSWSYIGRQCLAFPTEATMNFGWDLRLQPDTSLHEIGHALGFPHEHQNPFAGIVWDEPAVYEELAGPPNNWPKKTTYHNIIEKIKPSEVSGSEWDPDSIMHYPFEPKMILKPEKYFTEGLKPKGGLSPKDKEMALKVYPSQGKAKMPILQPFKSVELTLKPGEQADFSIVPDMTAKHVIQTVGSADTVLAIFEDKGSGNFVYMSGDDDSGTDRNAMITVKLQKGSKYVARVRLYSKFKSGRFGILLTVE
jgi:hypothetical protein